MRILVTGSAGFIGYHLSKLLIDIGHDVCGIDGLTDYYDVSLKRRRHENLQQHANFRCHEIMIEDDTKLNRIFEEFMPEVVIHLAAQAGVRYSLENPRAYLDANIVGTFNILDASKNVKVKHCLLASTSSVYGANENMPFGEDETTDQPLTFYAATKKANEVMAHSYSHIWNLPVTLFRFFTVYGPWGRPDMALFKFTKNILEREAIDVYNNGEMYRDFTYVTDLVRAISLLIENIPPQPDNRDTVILGDTLSDVAPHRVVNIGNSEKVKLTNFIDEIEKCLGLTAKKNLMPMQLGDVPATWANCNLLKNLTGYTPNTGVADGIAQFISWYKLYYLKD